VYSHETPAPVSFDPNLVASNPGVDTSNNAAGNSGDTSNVVTAAEQEAQEGRVSLD
jgi:hypothetical protein